MSTFSFGKSIGLLLVGLVLAGGARAQSGIVQGVVFDSLDGRPLGGALVQLVAAPPDQRAYSDTSDSLGRFRLEGVHAGSYIAGFLHPLLDSLGLTAPYRAVMVSDRDTARLALVVPAAASLTRAICSPVQGAAADSTGTLVGHVRDATSGAWVANSLVAAVWSELTLDARGIRRELRQVHGKTNSEGWFAMCGLGGGDYQLRAELGARATGFIDLTLRPRSITRVSLVLGADSDTVVATDSTPRRGGATVAGVVTNAGGHPVEGAQVVVEGSGASAITSTSGTFSLSGIPDGTRMAEARALGYAPTRVAIEPSRAETKTVSIVMDKKVKTLDAITVYGKPSGRFRDLTGFVQRRQSGFGRFVTRADIDQQNPISVCDLFRRVVGLQVTEGGVGGCSVTMRGAASMLRPGSAGGACEPTVYLDNMRFDGTLGDFAQTITPREIMGIEVYSTATEPPQYPGSCGTIVVWTQ